MANDRFKMLAYSGAEIKSGWWGKMAIDVAGIRADARLPALREHMRERPVGVVDRTTKAGPQLLAEGYFLDVRDGRECKGLIAAGYPMQASVGIHAESIEEVKDGSKATVNGRTFTGPGVIWRQSHVREISFVSLGADAGTSVSIAASLNNAFSRGVTLAADTSEFRTFEEAVTYFFSSGKAKTRTEAIKLAARHYPDLHEQYLVRVNMEHRTRQAEKWGR